ncbi:uncharacterized protein BO97DRAFT_103374 [Aspergillus homomorphus CBS 101889]|uniref:Uncharacterized protein n=1 Tax=Aspergillus homomorphus (strain CBS 101889) TaxID=1450537 RepID=A0A395HVH9_ASPHC|nr:hypothetical protein BO97DRAFT_103374 [Aspergillus homomorphus CBS 101889]RAL11395.1 hypothetical protein BO97DRAFT_103374 [Aspergillus homomorphus CBS 101889]
MPIWLVSVPLFLASRNHSELTSRTKCCHSSSNRASTGNPNHPRYQCESHQHRYRLCLKTTNSHTYTDQGTAHWAAARTLLTCSSPFPLPFLYP